MHESNYERPLEFEAGASLIYIIFSPLQKKLSSCHLCGVCILVYEGRSKGAKVKAHHQTF